MSLPWMLLKQESSLPLRMVWKILFCFFFGICFELVLIPQSRREAKFFEVDKYTNLRAKKNFYKPNGKFVFQIVVNICKSQKSKAMKIVKPCEQN